MCRNLRKLSELINTKKTQLGQVDKIRNLLKEITLYNHN